MLPELFSKIILAILLFIILLFPVYRFIFILSARKHDKYNFKVKKKYIKKKSLIYAIIITLIFSFIYSYSVF